MLGSVNNQKLEIAKTRDSTIYDCERKEDFNGQPCGDTIRVLHAIARVSTYERCMEEVVYEPKASWTETTAAQSGS